MLVFRAKPAPPRITILFDAFTNKPDLTADWGYAALVEFEGTRLRIDLTRLDLVVLSHRHGDHTSGLRYVLSVNPRVPIYAPADEPFNEVIPPAFLTQSADVNLPSKMRYFGGKVPTPPPPHGTAWPGVHVRSVVGVQEITPRIHLFSTVAETPGFRDLPEVSLVLDTARGPIVVVGCSHAGIENILSNFVQQTHRPDIYEVIGGMHLLLSTSAQVDHVVSELVERYHVQRVAAGHCTGEHMFAVLEKRFGKEYLYAGLGEALQL